MSALNILAVQNTALLRAIVADPLASKNALAEVTGKDRSNLNRSVAALTDAGLVEETESGARRLTDAGRTQLAAIERAEAVPSSSEAVGPGSGEPGSSAPIAGVLALAHAQILPDPENARRDWDSDEAQDELDALRQDIIQNGLLQNLVVRPAEPLAGGVEIVNGAGEAPNQALALYTLVGGERRWRAIGAAIFDGDWPEDRLIPCRLLETDDLGHRLAALAENLQRRNLNPIEKAKAFEGLADAGLSNKEIADRVSSTPEHVQQHRRFLQLDEADQQRMTLAKDDPRHLSVREARQRLAAKSAKEEAWKPTDLTAEEQLVLAEMTFAAREVRRWLGSTFAVASDARADPVAIRLAESNLITLGDAPHSFGDHVGHYFASFKGWAVSDACRSAWPALCGDKAETRLAALHAIQADLAGPSEGDAWFRTAWLNGPFELTEEGREILRRREAEAKERLAEAAEREARTSALAARHAEARAKHLAILNAAAEAPPSDLTTATVEAASAVERPVPWTLLDNGDVVDGNGEQVSELEGGYGQPDDQEMLLKQLVIVAVNSAAGLPTPPIKSAEAHYAERDADDDDQPSEEPTCCRVCGCTESNACVDDENGPCSWAEPDLCTSCVGSEPATDDAKDEDA